MNTLLLTFENLGFNSLSCFGGQLIETVVLDSIAKQGVCFRNCRLESPVGKDNLKNMMFRVDELFKTPVYFSNKYNDFEECINKDQFFAWRNFKSKGESLGIGDLFNNHEDARKTIDWFDKNNLLKNTIIILMGIGSHNKRSDHPFDVFKPGKLTLYDECLHVPLMVVHPDFDSKDVLNSISSNNIPESIYHWMGFSEEKTHLNELCAIDCQNREDIYSRHKNTYGLRGPMFQYFCSVKDGKAVAQELYDLNNDYEMSNNLMVHEISLGGQIRDLIKTYRERVLCRSGNENPGKSITI